MNFDEFIEKVISYLNGETIWSAFSQHSGTTRDLVLKFFQNNHKTVTGEQISDAVIARIGRALDDEELKKLNQVAIAWREWQYIISHFKN